jgi:PTS system mannose-specific IIA component
MAVPVVFVGHGGIAAGVRDAVCMILGDQPGLGTVSLPPNGSTEELAEQLRAELARLGAADGEALVLADLMGGSPANAVGALAMRTPALQLVSGLNLPMALEVLTSTETTAAGLAEVALRAGREGVLDVAGRLREAMRSS